MRPQRIQRKRVRGWSMPVNAVYVGRGSAWGNPFSLDVIHHAAACGLMTYEAPQGLSTELILPSKEWCVACQRAAVELYRGLIVNAPAEEREKLLAPLRGRDLACWCAL